MDKRHDLKLFFKMNFTFIIVRNRLHLLKVRRYITHSLAHFPSTTLAIVHAAANNFHQQYQALHHENERLHQHVRTLSPPSPASTVTLPLPGHVSVRQHYITEYCVEKRDPITGKRII